MTTPAWPVSVTLVMDKASYRERPERNVSQFAVDLGPPLEARNSAIPTDIVEGTIPCTSATEYEALRDFYRNDCKDGILVFSRSDPRTGVAGKLFKFESFQLQSIRGDVHFVSVVLRAYR